MENIYNRDLRVVNIKLDKKCLKCDGEGVITKKKNNCEEHDNNKSSNIELLKQNKNSRNKKKKET